MTDVVPLKDANREPVPYVVSYLEKALKLAQDGELRDVMIVGSLTGNRTYTSFSVADIPLSVGYLAVLQGNMLAKMRGSTEEMFE